MEENLYDAKRNQTTNDNTVVQYDRVRGGLEGVAMFTRPTTVQNIQILTGKSETFIVETARHPELGDTIFVQCMNEDGLVRLAMPPKVATAIARQKDALTGRARSRSAKILAQQRKARGEVPGFMKNKMAVGA